MTQNSERASFNLIQFPISRFLEKCVLCDHHRLDATRVWDMRSNAQINHRATAVDSRGLSVGHLGIDKVLFVFVVLQRR